MFPLQDLSSSSPPCMSNELHGVLGGVDGGVVSEPIVFFHNGKSPFCHRVVVVSGDLTILGEMIPCDEHIFHNGLS